MKNESNVPCYFLCDYQSDANSSFAKFHEKILNLSQEIEKNTDNVPRNKTQKAQAKGNTPQSFLVWQSSECYQKYIRKMSEETKQFSRNREKYYNTDQEIPKIGLQERRRCHQFFWWSKPWSNTKNIFTNLYGKKFNCSQ